MATLDKNFIVKNGLTVEGSTIISPAATTSFSSLRIPHGTAPSSPTNGDFWTTTSGAFARINGTTVSLGSSSASPTTEGILFGRTTDSGKLTALGYQALNGASSSNTDATAIGHRALFSMGTSSLRNVAVGVNSLLLLGTGSDNVTVGSQAIQNLTTGSQNIGIGNWSGAGTISLTSGSNNIIIGYNSSPSASTVSNEVTIGNENINRFRVPGLGIDWTSSTVPAPQDIIPLDDLYNLFDGFTYRFIPTYQGSQITISNPFRLLLIINGIIQYIDTPEYVWMSGFPRRGFFVDSEGQLQFSEPVPAGSEFDARLMPGAVTTTRTRVYPFKALDILLGG